MSINVTFESFSIVLFVVLSILQVIQYRRQDNINKEIDKVWNQISTFNTTVVLKLLEMMKEIEELKKKNI